MNKKKKPAKKGKETARVYMRKNSRIKKALKFSTGKKGKLA